MSGKLKSYGEHMATGERVRELKVKISEAEYQVSKGTELVPTAVNMGKFEIVKKLHTHISKNSDFIAAAKDAVHDLENGK